MRGVGAQEQAVPMTSAPPPPPGTPTRRVRPPLDDGQLRVIRHARTVRRRRLAQRVLTRA
jgi:hypothetical protein